jgi:NitT/TauT family transport system permease protein
VTDPVLTYQRADRERRTVDRDKAQRYALVLLGWGMFLLAWTAAATFLPGRVLPTPAAVVQEMWEIVTTGRFFVHFQASLLKVLAGFAVAVAIGVPVGYLMGRHRYWRAFFHDGVTVAGTIPGLTYAVLSLVVFGISDEGPVLAVALASLPFIVLNVAEGVRGVDQDLIKMSQAYNRTPAAIRRHVVIPAVVPFVLAGIRLSFAMAWKVAATVEVFGGRDGVGFQINREYQMFSVPGVLAWAFLFIVFMLVVERFVLVRIEDRVLAWRPAERGTA